MPKPRALGARDRSRSSRCARSVGAGKPLVYVDVIAPAGADVELFAEGPTADWALPVPMPRTARPRAIRRFGFELDGLPPGVDPKGRSRSG